MITITLPLPDKSLQPNRNNGRMYAFSNAARVKAHTMGYEAAKQYFGEFSNDVPIKIKIIAHKAKNVRYDLDNFLASMKKPLDGVFSGLGIDDSQVVDIRIIKGEVDKNNPRVELTISEIKE